MILSKDSWIEIITTIKRNKLRTIITLVGVIWGIFLLIVLLGSVKGMENGFNRAFDSFATNSIFMWAQNTSIPYKGFTRGRWMNLTTDDIHAIKKKFPEISFITPRNQLGDYGTPPAKISYNLQQFNFVTYGDYPYLMRVVKMKIKYGRFVNENDIIEKRKVAVLTEDAYNQLFDSDENPLGHNVKINDAIFQVIGVAIKNKHRGISSKTPIVYMPFTTFQNLFSRGNKISWMIINLKNNVNAVEVEEKVKAFLRLRHNAHPDDTQAFGAYNFSHTIGKITKFLKGMKFLTVIVGLFTLLAGVIGISAILLITVKERTRELGIRRALGAKPREVRNQILLESVFLTLIAGLIGIVAGVLLLAFLSFFESDDFMLVNPTVSFYTIFGALFTMVFLGTFIGFIPAYKAISIKPIDALRDE